MPKRNPNAAYFTCLVLGALTLSAALTFPVQAQASALVEVEKLDSAANLLLFISDSKRPRQCHMQAVEAQKLLMVIHPMIDESRKKAVSALKTQSGGRLVADPKWEKTCSKGCHCGLYGSILEDADGQGLEDSGREAMYRLNKKARQMTSKEAQACASRTAAWFCKSDLLKRLRKEAKDYPNPAHRTDLKTDSGSMHGSSSDPVHR